MCFFLILAVLCLSTAAYGFEREECEDISIRCRGWKKYCNDPANQFYMKNCCKKTCGWCPKCEDLSDKCSSMNCESPASPIEHEFLRKSCRLTCGICALPTLPPPTPPRPTFPVIPPGTCGVPKVRGSRTIGGVNAKKGAWPWQILIGLFGGTHCGGAIICPFWVVTATHCVYEKEDLADEFKVITGEDDFDKKEGTETSIGVERIFVHKGYSPNKLNDDIALLKLNRPAPFGTYVGTVSVADLAEFQLIDWFL